MKKLSFNASDGDEKANLNISFSGLGISDKSLAFFGIPMSKRIDASGDIKSDMKLVGDRIDVRQSIDIKADNLANLAFNGKAVFEKDGDFITADDLNLVLKDKGIVEVLPQAVKMMLASQLNLGDYSINEAIRTFLNTPDSTLKIKIRDNGGNALIEASVN